MHTFSSQRVITGETGINSCGVQPLRDREYHTVRTRIDWTVQFLASGTAEVCIDDVWTPLREGDAMLFLPNATQEYIFHGEAGCINKWVHFGGTLCRILDGAPVRVVHIAQRREFESDLDRLIRAWTLGEREMLCDGYLRAVLALLTESEKTQRSDPSALQSRLRAVLDHMHTHLGDPPDLDHCAASCCLSRDRFNHVFKEYTGFAPNAYRNHIRMERAKMLLGDEGFTPAECAEMLGFSGSNYFCRLFRKECGCTPMEYQGKKLTKGS